MTEPKFWEQKTLEEFSREEWESLCDGCGLCCLHKLEDIDSGELVYTNIVCRYYDNERCQCSEYLERPTLMPDCLVLTPALVRELTWLPESCAYRLVRDGEPLAWWHPLVSGSRDTVIEAGVSIQDRTISETYVHIDDWENHVVDLTLPDLDLETEEAPEDDDQAS